MIFAFELDTLIRVIHSWNSLLGQILHPTSYEYMNNLILSMPLIDTVTDYR